MYNFVLILIVFLSFFNNKLYELIIFLTDFFFLSFSYEYKFAVGKWARIIVENILVINS